MVRASFFVLLAACAGAHRTQAVEVAEPLPTVPASAVAAAAPVEARGDPAPPIDEHPERDPRALAARPVTELRQQARLAERLVAATALVDPARPMLLLRLAELYVRLRRAGDAGAADRALRAYDELVSKHPGFARIDRAYFGRAMEYEAKSDWMGARRAYFELIKKAPRSTYVPYAYYAFGEMFSSEAPSDPSKWGLARQAYDEVLKYPSSPIVPYAVCQMSRALDAQGRGADARALRATLARIHAGSDAARRCGVP